MRRNRIRAAVAVVAASALALGAAGSGGAAKQAKRAAQQEKVVFMSSQLNTVAESEAFRKTILKGFSGDVDFVNTTADNVASRIRAESQAGRGTVSLVGDVEGNFVFYQEALRDHSNFAKTALARVKIPAPLMRLGKLGTRRQLFIPWMQATYIMAANTRALRHLPKGARLNDLTYPQLLTWARNLRRAYGRAVVGFPAGPTGLMLRYLHGYLLPSFSGGVVTTFKSNRSVQAWTYLRDLWQYVHPQSFQYNNMSDPLLTGEVLLVWDHVARLGPALKARPSTFVTFSVPRGTRGRAYLPVVAGVSIPKTAPNPAGARALIRFLLTRGSQARTLGSVGFFPVVTGRYSRQLGTGLLKMEATVRRLQKDKRAILSGLPIGLGPQSANFTRIFNETLTRIVVRRENVREVLDDQGNKLQAILDQVKAPCFRPDPPSRGTCRVGG